MKHVQLQFEAPPRCNAEDKPESTDSDTINAFGNKFPKRFLLMSGSTGHDVVCFPYKEDISGVELGRFCSEMNHFRKELIENNITRLEIASGRQTTMKNFFVVKNNVECKK